MNGLKSSRVLISGAISLLILTALFMRLACDPVHIEVHEVDNPECFIENNELWCR